MRALLYTVWCIAYVVGVTYEVIKDQEGENLRCNSSTVISCKFSANVSILYWKIAPDVKNTSITAATCFMNSCSPHSLFLTNYLFTFDKLLSVSNVTIKAVTIEHNNLEFWCDDKTTPEQIKLNVTEPPTIETTVLTNTTDELIIETQCVYPTDNINIKWFSKQINGSDRQQHIPSSPGHQLCNTSSECILANKSARITSALKLSTLTSINSSSQRSFEVEIIYGSGNYTYFLGNFFVPDKTETTTYSTVILTPTPTIVITSTLSPVITPSQTILISPTPTTVASPTSTIVLPSSSTDKTLSSTEQNFPNTPEKNKSIIIGSATGGVVILIIIISAFVCYIKRKRRNERKTKKHMLSKKDTVQENRL